jgi:hypothetical protein
MVPQGYVRVKSLSQDPILTQMSPVHILILYLFKKVKLSL